MDIQIEKAWRRVARIIKAAELLLDRKQSNVLAWFSMEEKPQGGYDRHLSKWKCRGNSNGIHSLLLPIQELRSLK